jgi:hypothetical protein
MTRSKIPMFLRATALAAAAGLCWPALADEAQNDRHGHGGLRAGQWVQWIYSIPTSVSPLLDITGQQCMVGQNGSTWYLVPRSGSGTASRSCTVPHGVKLQFAVAGLAYIYTPGFCGDVPGTPVSELRAAIAPFADSLTVTVTLDGQRVKARRIRSEVFSSALPADNLLNPLCGGPGTVPAGVYLTVDDSYYAEIDDLRPGTYTLQMQATNGGTFNRNVVYSLTVLPRLRH